MKYSEKCQCCGHIKTAYTLPLNDSLARAFVRFAEKTINGSGLKKGDIGLTNAQYSNFQNLRHFGIVIQYEKGKKWYLTELGKRFYHGEASVVTPAAHLGGETLSDYHEAWNTHEKMRKSVLIHDILPKHYKQREEYKDEKRTDAPNLFI